MRSARTLAASSQSGKVPAADIGADPVDPRLVDFRPDVVEHRAGDALAVGRGEEHGADATQRRAEEDRIRNPLLVQQLQDVGDIVKGRSGWGPGRAHSRRGRATRCRLPATHRHSARRPARNRGRCGSVPECTGSAACRADRHSRGNGGEGRRHCTSNGRSNSALRFPPASLPYRGPMAKPQPIPILELGENFYDAVEPAAFPECHPRFLNRRWAERVGLGLDEDWDRHFAVRATARQSPSRWRFAITATSSACTIRRSATAVASFRPTPRDRAACSTSAPRAAARRLAAGAATVG